jgi:hypothetical protein
MCYYFLNLGGKHYDVELKITFLFFVVIKSHLLLFSNTSKSIKATGFVHREEILQLGVIC